MVARCARCGRLGVLAPWPLRREVFGFGTAAVAAMGWRACVACVAFVRSVVDQLTPSEVRSE